MPPDFPLQLPLGAADYGPVPGGVALAVDIDFDEMDQGLGSGLGRAVEPVADRSETPPLFCAPNGRQARHLAMYLATALAFFALVTVRSPARGGAAAITNRGVAAVQLLDESPAEAQRLTQKYVNLRMRNDVEGLTALMTPETKMHINLSGAGWLLGPRIRMSTGTDMQGPDGLAKYYRTFPAKAEDVKPSPDEYTCSGDMCRLTFTIKRFPVGAVEDTASIAWDLDSQTLRSVDMKLVDV